MSAQRIREIPPEGRLIAGVLSAHTLKLARPLIWHIGAQNQGVPRGATAFVLQFEKKLIAVTAEHVFQEYIDALSSDSRMVCQLGYAQVAPEKAVIGRSKKLDIATFEIHPSTLTKMDGEIFDCRGQWPPPPVQEGNVLTLTGFLENHRVKTGRQSYDMQAYGGHGLVESFSDREILTTYDPEKMLHAHLALKKPPLGFNMSGCSGGPVVMVKEVNKLLRLFPVGLIYKGPDGEAKGEFASFDRIHIRRIHFIQPDGTINNPDPDGW